MPSIIKSALVALSAATAANATALSEAVSAPVPATLQPRSHIQVHLEAYTNRKCLGDAFNEERLDADEHSPCQTFAERGRYEPFESFSYDWGKWRVSGEDGLCDIEVWNSWTCTGKKLKIVKDANKIKDGTVCIPVPKGARGLKIVCHGGSVFGDDDDQPIEPGMQAMLGEDEDDD